MLLQGSAEAEARTLATLGAALVLCCLAASGFLVVNPFASPETDHIFLAIDTPYVVQGVTGGTPVVSHGIEIGKVTAVSKLSGGAVRLDVGLQRTPGARLTDAMQIDFRPVNSFGVTGINITPGAGGRALREGMRINAVPKGNFSLQAMLFRLGELSTGVLTPRLIAVIDRATRYTDAFEPLIETLFITTSAVAQVQTVPTARLLTNATGLSVVFPSFLRALTDAGDAVSHADFNYLHKGIGDLTNDEWYKTFGIPYWEAVAVGVFTSFGQLESAHVADLLPLVNGFHAITNTIPPLLRPVGVGDMLVELRKRFEKLYAGTPEQRALQVRIVLHSLPGVAAPLGIGAP